MRAFFPLIFDGFFLPLKADPEEHSRLDMQHEMLKKKMGGLFLVPNAVRRAMAPRQDQEPAAMDIGTGTYFLLCTFLIE